MPTDQVTGLAGCDWWMEQETEIRKEEVRGIGNNKERSMYGRPKKLEEEMPTSMDKAYTANTIRVSPSPSTRTLWIGLPRKDVSCPVCGLNIMGAWTLSKHLKSRHKKAKVMYTCLKCDWNSSNCHAVACHAPKCKGTNSVKEKNEKCDQCGKGFETKRGLSQHARHAHPMIWNDKKLAKHKSKAIIKRHGKAGTKIAVCGKSGVGIGRLQTPKRMKISALSRKLVKMRRLRWRSRVLRRSLDLSAIGDKVTRGLKDMDAKGVSEMAEKERLKHRFAESMEKMAKQMEGVGAGTMMELVKMGEGALRVVEMDMLSLVQQQSDSRKRKRDRYPRRKMEQRATGSKERRRKERDCEMQNTHRCDIRNLQREVGSDQ